MINVTIAGRLGKDPELRYTQTQQAVCSMNVASTTKYNNQETTTWAKLTFWGKTAETVANYFKKGQQIIATGRGSLSSYTTDDGKTFTNLEINVSQWEFGANPDAPTQQTQATRPAQQTQQIDMDDIPF